MADGRAIVVTHVGHEDLAGFRAPVEAAGYAVETVYAPTARLGAGWRTADLVVVMGGPMGAYERDAYPWLADTVAGLAERIADNGPTLGICLGSQLIALALEAEVRPGPVKEVGFAPLRLLPAAAATPLRHLAGVPLLHWHGDTFDLPAGTERLAETDAYPNQAFRHGPRLLALQCHPEVGAEPDLAAWLAGADDYLAAAGTDAATVARDHRALGPAAAAAGRRLMAEWLAGLGG